MASIRKEILTKASVDAVWAALRDISALHTRLVPGFVVDTRLEPGVRIVTFANGMTVRELIVDIDDKSRRVVWSVQSEIATHHNASVQVIYEGEGRTKVVWIADLLPNEAVRAVGPMMDQGMAVMKTTLNALAEKP